jgi:hypothetical protein
MKVDAPVRLDRTRGGNAGWAQVAKAVEESVAVETIDRIWLFAPVRRDDREWGTAVVSCHAPGERRRIYTVTYLVVVRGRERGRGRVSIEQAGESPVAVVEDVIAGVQERAGEPDPPIEIPPNSWFGDSSDESAPES